MLSSNGGACALLSICHEIEDPFDLPDPLEPPEDGDEPSELDDYDLPCTDEDARWDVFIADDDEQDPLPERGDFWANDEFPNDQ